MDPTCTCRCGSVAGPGCSTFQPNWPNRCGGVSTSAAVESALAEISAINLELLKRGRLN